MRIFGISKDLTSELTSGLTRPSNIVDIGTVFLIDGNGNRLIDGNGNNLIL